MKLVELLIDDQTGIDAISIVDAPAIGQNFYWFNSVEEFVEPSAGESEEEFIPRCIAKLVGEEGYETEQATAVCYSYWTGGFGADTSGLSPWVDQVTRKKKDITVQPVAQFSEATVANAVYEALAEIEQVPVDFEVMFKYLGPGPEREWCDVKYAREFSLQQIVNMRGENSGLSMKGQNEYDKFLYKGGVNCQHHWQASSIVFSYLGGKKEKILFREQDHMDYLVASLSQFSYSLADYRTAQTPMSRFPDGGRVTPREVKMSKTFAFVDEEKKTVVGPLMIPDIKILRQDETTGEYYNVFFSSSTIEKAREKYMKELKINNSNLQHNEEIPLDVVMLENWIIEDPNMDKSGLWGFSLPKGTWMGMYRVENEEVWKAIKEGTFNGFSIEGAFVELPRGNFAGLKVSFDWDDTLSTQRGKDKALEEIANGNTVYVITARNDANEILSQTDELGIPQGRVYAVGSNRAKIDKVLELGIDKHYDNNPDVIAELGSRGVQF